MTRVHATTAGEPPTGLLESRVNELLLIAARAIDDASRMLRQGAEHGVDSRFTIASAPGLKGGLLELLPV